MDIHWIVCNYPFHPGTYTELFVIILLASQSVWFGLPAATTRDKAKLHVDRAELDWLLSRTSGWYKAHSTEIPYWVCTMLYYYLVPARTCFSPLSLRSASENHHFLRKRKKKGRKKRKTFSVISLLIFPKDCYVFLLSIGTIWCNF